MYKIVRVFASLYLVFLSSYGFAMSKQTDYTIEMADAMRENGKIYIVVITILILFIFFFLYLIYLDRKVSKLYKKITKRQ